MSIDMEVIPTSTGYILSPTNKEPVHATIYCCDKALDRYIVTVYDQYMSTKSTCYLDLNVAMSAAKRQINLLLSTEKSWASLGLTS